MASLVISPYARRLGLGLLGSRKQAHSGSSPPQGTYNVELLLEGLRCLPGLVSHVLRPGRAREGVGAGVPGPPSWSGPSTTLRGSVGVSARLRWTVLSRSLGLYLRYVEESRADDSAVGGRLVGLVWVFVPRSLTDVVCGLSHNPANRRGWAAASEAHPPRYLHCLRAPCAALGQLGVILSDCLQSPETLCLPCVSLLPSRPARRCIRSLRGSGLVSRTLRRS